MLGSAPEKKFDFDMGLTIKGTINTDIANYQDYNVKLSCLSSNGP